MAIDPYYKSRLARKMIRQGRELMERIFAVHDIKLISGVDDRTFRHMKRVAIYAMFDRWLDHHRPNKHYWTVNKHLDREKFVTYRWPSLERSKNEPQ